MPLTIRHGLSRRWLRSAEISLVICALLFGFTVLRDRCWLYWPYYTVSKFVMIWLWLLLFLNFRMKGRLLLLVVALLLVVFWGAQDTANTQYKSASALGRLRSLHQAMADYKSHHQTYPKTLPDVSTNSGVENYYRFELVASHSPDDKVVDYLIQATPYHPLCRAMMSFAVADDGRIFYTREPRAATANDRVLN